MKRKPAWVGEVTPDIAEIRDGRDWADLDRESWQRIAAIVDARPEAVRTPGGRTIKGAHRDLGKLRRSTLWLRKRDWAEDPESGIVDWSGGEREPEHPQLVEDRSRPGAPPSYHVTTEADQWQDVDGLRLRVVPRPRRAGERPGPKYRTPTVDLTNAAQRAELTAAWVRAAGDGYDERTWRRIASVGPASETSIRRAFKRDGYDLDHYYATGEVVPKR